MSTVNMLLYIIWDQTQNLINYFILEKNWHWLKKNKVEKGKDKYF